MKGKWGHLQVNNLSNLAVIFEGVDLHARLTHFREFLHRKVNPLPVAVLAGLLVIWGSKLNTITGSNFAAIQQL